MALCLTRHVVMLRSSPSAVGRCANNTRRALSVRAFKDEHKQKEQKLQQTQDPQAPSRDPSAPTAAASTPESVAAVAPPPLPLEVLPFRRMTDAMSQMQREMDALMDSFGLDDPFFGGFGAPRRSSRRVGGPLSPFSLLDSLMMPGLPANSNSSTTTATPSSLARAVGPLSRMVPVEVTEDDQSITITAEVPGFAKEHIKVEVDPARKLLTISGEKTSGAEGQTEAGGSTKEGEPTALARSSMTFIRSFSLPPVVDMDKEVKASAEHGVLKVVLPKVPRQEPATNVRQIPVA